MIPALIDYLTIFYQTGNLAQVEVIARSILTAVPKDVVALQFLGLALYQMGRVDDARHEFKRVAAMLEQQEEWDGRAVCEPAHVAIFRAATRAGSGLADGWYRIGLALNVFGLHKSAARAFESAIAARGFTETTAVSDD